PPVPPASSAVDLALGGVCAGGTLTGASYRVRFRSWPQIGSGGPKGGSPSEIPVVRSMRGPRGASRRTRSRSRAYSRVVSSASKSPVFSGPGNPRRASQSLTLSDLGLDEGEFELRALAPFGLQLRPLAAREDDWLHERVLTRDRREAFYALVAAAGLVSVAGQAHQHPTYRGVRGRSSKGRLSQGEYYHHDGCSGPVKPRIVEIRCPLQVTARHVATAVAPYPATVAAMLQELPEELLSQLRSQWAGDETL